MNKKTLKILAKEEGIKLDEDSCPLLEMEKGNLKIINTVKCDDNCDKCWNRKSYTLKN